MSALSDKTIKAMWIVMAPPEPKPYWSRRGMEQAAISDGAQTAARKAKPAHRRKRAAARGT
jgi:hypothetical protein